MYYNHITYVSTQPAERYVDSNWVQSDETTFLKKHVLARGAYLLLTPASFIISAVDTIIGLGAGIGAICTIGKHQFTVKVAFNHISASKDLFVLPYVNFLLAINPEARFSGDRDSDGFLSRLVINRLKRIESSFCNSDNFLRRHVASRLTYALLAVSLLVTRAVDGILGIQAAGLSILTGGKFEFFNNLAYKTLQAPSIINDLFYLTIKFINPWTVTPKDSAVPAEKILAENIFNTVILNNLNKNNSEK